MKPTASIHRRSICYGLCAASLLAGCGRKADPEQQLRSTLASMQQAYKGGHADDFMAHVSEDFTSDDGSLRRADVRRLLVLAALRNRDALIVADIGEVRIDGTRATVALRVYTAGGEGGLLQRPLDLKTAWRRDGNDWKVYNASAQ
ncbi:hypothetical protein BH09PSE6_BH09PSE6_31060 [soil metagenome]